MADIPQVPHVTDLTVKVSSPGGHAFGASVAHHLSRCGNLRRLQCLSRGCICDGHPAGWAEEEGIPPLLLPRLREVEFRGFVGCHRVAPLLLAAAPAVEGMAVTASPREVSLLRHRKRSPPWKTAVEVDRALESRLPACSRGNWGPARGSADAPAFRWTPPDRVEDTEATHAQNC